jgi:hypothetical protein
MITALAIFSISCLVFLTIIIFALLRDNVKLRQELSNALHSLAVSVAAREGDFDSARLMAAVKRDELMIKTRPPVSAGAKQKQTEHPGDLTIEQSG